MKKQLTNYKLAKWVTEADTRLFEYFAYLPQQLSYTLQSFSIPENLIQCGFHYTYINPRPQNMVHILENNVASCTQVRAF
jgi:hypothetical protein